MDFWIHRSGAYYVSQDTSQKIHHQTYVVGLLVPSSQVGACCVLLRSLPFSGGYFCGAISLSSWRQALPVGMARTYPGQGA